MHFAKLSRHGCGSVLLWTIISFRLHATFTMNPDANKSAEIKRKISMSCNLKSSNMRLSTSKLHRNP